MAILLEIDLDSATGRILKPLMNTRSAARLAMVTAVYSFLGTELVGVTVGEAKHPRLSMPKGIRLTFYRILFFYILSVFLPGMVVPRNSMELVFASRAKASAASSPFVVAIKLAKLQGLDHVVNACLIIFVFSATNSDRYIATRTLYGIAADGNAPKVFCRATKHGVPFVAIGLCISFCGLAYLSVSASASVVFGYLTNVVTIFSKKVSMRAASYPTDRLQVF